ncbi:MAG: 2-C-methyl-D-erythritol 2,4-cyclodiphosphate synthase [Bacteroidales bacterium]|nr:2-C-methyl-D-erythritol 2,4-cyclodiphosphate synthase [Bacteroidales bacterium]
MPFRIGIGYDVHPLVEGRKLIVGGVLIPSAFGVDGHSDADVLIHAIADALLGSLALGDIGHHFPPDNEKFKDLDSTIILASVYNLILQKGYALGNLDAVVVLQKPKIAPYIEKMRERLAQVMQVNPDQISVKATTTEHLGFVGRSEGLAAYASVLVIKKA